MGSLDLLLACIMNSNSLAATRSCANVVTHFRGIFSRISQLRSPYTISNCLFSASGGANKARFWDMNSPVGMPSSCFVANTSKYNWYAGGVGAYSCLMACIAVLARKSSIASFLLVPS